MEEISRSEGYELSRTGKNHSESNRTGIPVVLTESGSAHTGGFLNVIFSRAKLIIKDAAVVDDIIYIVAELAV